ncbi:MAG: hypothetical protein PF487_01495 [Bacteroidales bacterium]|nr:hypothetical protein [Bacteroidales bacterium]
MELDIKEIIKDNTVTFAYYRAGYLFYNVIYREEVFMFPVPIDDIGDATFLNTDRAMFLMRYIKKAIEEKTFVRAN